MFACQLRKRINWHLRGITQKHWRYDFSGIHLEAPTTLPNYCLPNYRIGSASQSALRPTQIKKQLLMQRDKDVEVTSGKFNNKIQSKG